MIARVQILIDCLRFLRAIGPRGRRWIHVLWSSLDAVQRERFARAAGPALNEAWNRVRSLSDDHTLIKYTRGQISKDQAVARPGYRDYTELLVAIGDYGLELPRLPVELEDAMVDEFADLLRREEASETAGITVRMGNDVVRLALRRQVSADTAAKYSVVYHDSAGAVEFSIHHDVTRNLQPVRLAAAALVEAVSRVTRGRDPRY